MQFIDEAKIYIKAGDGGRGCMSFRREKFIEEGGPDGGNGGRGADIIFIASKDLNTLIDFRYRQHFKAEAGKGGKGKNRTGKSGDTLYITVPVGTQIVSEDGYDIIADMNQDKMEFLIAKGGDGGRGNINYKSSINQAPTKATKGFEGDELWVWLKLKLLSDVGLLGLPNAGKSTFLSVVSAAKPKIADYPFTTLKPQLGVVYSNHDEFVLADIPGLIEGASEGKGLGDKFLRHLERCSILLHLIDGSSEDVVADYKTILKEVNSYSDTIKEKKRIIVITKTDILDEEDLKEKTKLLKKASKCDVYNCSAATNSNIKKIVDLLMSEVKQHKESDKL